MPTTSFAGRRPQYLEQYARTVAAFQRYQDITRDIQAEQDRLNYLDSLVQSERQNLTNLQEVFRVRPQDLGSAQ
jgi:CHASE3 domain sensor protein